MGAVTKLFVITLLAIVCTNGAYVKDYVPMELSQFRDVTETASESTPRSNESSEKVTTEPTESEKSNENKNDGSDEEDETIENKISDDNKTGDLGRKKKSATTTFCVEIRPSDPYQKPFQVCEPAHPGYKPQSYPQQAYQQHSPTYSHHQPAHHQQSPYIKNPYQQQSQGQQPHGHQPQVHRPSVTYQPHGSQHLAGPEYSAPVRKPQTGYAAAPTYGQQPASDVQALSYAPDYRPPSAMVVPHVPVAEPYHVPQPQIRGGYRTSSMDGDWDIEAEDGEDTPDGNARTAYNSYESHGPTYGHGKTIYKYEKDKKIDYIPVMVKTIKKTKPLKFLKVYKDLKKGKLQLYDDDDYKPEYGGHEYGGHGYGGHEYGGHGNGGHEYGGHGYGFAPESEIHHESDFGHHAGGNQHGLVITCQPSAVGYAGGQTQLELQRHMDLLKNIYSASEKIFAGSPKTEFGPGLAYSAGYGASGGAAHPTGVAASVSVGNEGGYVPPSTYRNAEPNAWEQPSQMRSSNGENRKLSAPQNWEAKNQMNMNMNENVGNPMNIPSSAQPMMMVSPTENVQKQLDTTASFRATRGQTNQGTT